MTGSKPNKKAIELAQVITGKPVYKEDGTINRDDYIDTERGSKTPYGIASAIQDAINEGGLRTFIHPDVGDDESEDSPCNLNYKVKMDIDDMYSSGIPICPECGEDLEYEVEDNDE